MRSVNCTPNSYPKIPETHNHSYWDSWDLTVDLCLSQLPSLFKNKNLEYSVYLK
jgi:regulator-associated protein of mTOR